MDIFERVRRQWHVCSNCFRRTHDVWTATHVLTTHNRELWAKRIEDVEMADPAPETEKVGTDDGMTRRCECGVLRNSTWVRPLDKQTFFTHASRLADRIEEYDFPGTFDRQLFFDELEQLKAQPDNQFEDDELYSRAVEKAVTLQLQDERRVQRTGLRSSRPARG